MDAPTPAGPAGGATWEVMQTGAGPLRPLSVLRIPDAANPARREAGLAPIYYVVLATPQLNLRDGEPILSLTLVLDRLPTSGDDTLAPLIRQGTLACELTLDVSPEGLDVLNRLGEGEYRRLFAREAAFSLVFAPPAAVEGEQMNGEEPAAAVEGEQMNGEEPAAGEQLLSTGLAGNGPLQAALTASLSQDQTLAAHSTLNGTETGLRLRTRLSYRAVSPELYVRLEGSWAEIYDEMKERLGLRAFRTATELRTVFDVLLEMNLVTVYELSSGEQRLAPPVPADLAGELFRMFLSVSFPALTRETTELAPGDSENRYSLRPQRPHSFFQLRIEQHLTSDRLRWLDLDCGLERIFGGVLEVFDRERFIHIVTSSGLEPRRVHTARTRSTRSNSGRAAKVSLAIIGEKGSHLASVASSLRPSAAALTPQALIASDLIEPVASTQTVEAWWVDDLVLAHPDAEKFRHLPVVRDVRDGLWPDRVNPRLYWYAPAFEPIKPPANADPANSPFRFSFQRTGATDTGEPALRGTVEFTMRKMMSSAAKKALTTLDAAGVTTREIPTPHLSVSLSVPFIDHASGKVRRHSFDAEITQSEAVIIGKVELISEWVRLCYGALSEPGFQGEESAKFHITYTFEAYVPISKNDLELAAVGKVGFTPLLTAREAGELEEPIFFDSGKTTFHHPNGEFRLREEPPLQPSRRAVARGEILGLAATGAVSRPVELAVMARPVENTEVFIRPLPQDVVIARPHLRPVDTLEELVAQVEYGIRTQLRQERAIALYPCQELGAFYREILTGGPQLIGCQDALKLGEITYRQYAELTDLAHPQYRVYRSLQQPGRFLVLPAHYRITRYEPDRGDRAYEPDMLVYSILDTDNPTNNRVIFKATLQPDLPPYLRRGLLVNLAAHSARPVIEFPTELVAEMTYRWDLVGGLQIEPDAVRLPDAFEVSLATDLAGALLLRTLLENSGLSAEAQFHLPDGSVLRSTLSMDLRAITGPWQNGPLETRLEGGRARLTNRIEGRVAVSDVDLYPPDGGVARRLPAEVILEPGGEHSLDLGGAAGESVAVYTIPSSDPVALEEIRRLVEDISTNVIFVDLIHHPNHNLARLEVRARLKDFGSAQIVDMSGAPPTGQILLVLPLTLFMEKHILQFQVTKTFAGGQQAETTPWFDWDLNTRGIVIGLTWELIQ